MAKPRNHDYDALEGGHGYHLNTAEDSKGDEHLYVIEFNKRLPEIKAYMKAHHVPAEKAFQGVTGKPWPEGRSVELKRGDSVGFMTKDRTIRSVLGKSAIAAGIGAGAYFAAPALAGVGGGAPAGATPFGATGSGIIAGPGIAGVEGASALGGTAAAGGTTAAVTTAAKSPSIWSKIAGPAVTTGIKAGTDLYGTHMQVKANEKAAEAAAKAAEEALQWQKDVFGIRQEQLAPAIGVGNTANLRLGDLMGLKAPEGGYHAPVMPSHTGATATGPATAAPPATATPPPAAPQTVKMRAPNGEESIVPVDQVPHFTQLGATVVA